MKRFLLPVLLMNAGPLVAQARPVAPRSPVAAIRAVTLTPSADKPSTKVNGKTVQGKKVKVVMAPNLFSPPQVTRPLTIAVYYGGGAGKGNSDLLVKAGKRLKGATVIPITPRELVSYDLSQFDVLVFAGGSGSGQAKAIGDKGLEKVRNYVKKGGGYLGICAGAYLACSNYSWSLGLMNARTRSSLWMRGGGAVSLQLTDDGQKIFGDVKDTFPVRYNNGPIIEPDSKSAAPPYTVIAWFRDELAEHRTPVGLMTNSPAAVCSQYGQGKVLTISPHFEGTENAENFLPTALAWLGDKTTPLSSQSTK